MPLWMKAQRTQQGKPRYTVAELNHHPLGMPAVAIAALLGTVRLYLHSREEKLMDRGVWGNRRYGRTEGLETASRSTSLSHSPSSYQA